MPPAKSKTGRPSVWAPAIGGANAALEADSLKLQQVLLITAFLASALFFSGASFASFELPKFVAIGTLVIVAAGISAARAVLGGLVVLPRWEATIAIALFIAGLAVATLTSPSFHISVIGNYTRFTGFVPYALYAMAFLLVLRSFDERAVRRLGVSVIAAAALAAFYGLLQWGGADPIRWGGVYAETVFATFGNPNFAAGWFAMALPFAAWGALRETWAWQWRIASALVGVASLLVISATDAEQGIFAGGAGVAVFALAWLRARLRDDLRTAVTAGWAVLAVAVTTLAALGLATIGPLSALGTQSSFALRKTYWEAALRMFASDVPTGVGLDMFASYFPAYRSREALDLLGPGVTI
ncbi:MAG: O-antigen ligase family protein, partial [Dehalococcoidia bacterium]